MSSGNLIRDLLDIVERVSTASESSQSKENESSSGAKHSETEQFSQTLGLSPADGNLSLFLVVHPKLVGTLEPGDDLANSVDIDQVRAVGPPK